MLPVGNTLCIQRSADDVVTYTRQVTDSSAADQDNRVLLQVVSDTGNVDRCFQTVGKTYSRDLTKSGVRLFGGHRLDDGADASLLGSGKIDGSVLYGVETLLKSGGGGFIDRCLSSLPDELVERRQIYTSLADIIYIALSRQYTVITP